MDAAERQYSQHLSTIAPYIQAAFAQWYEQDAMPALPDFLDHYFGRPPNGSELNQVQQLLSLKTQLSRDQEELRVLHAQSVKLASRERKSSGHWSPSSALRPSAGAAVAASGTLRSPVNTSSAKVMPAPDSSRLTAQIVEPAPPPSLSSSDREPPGTVPGPSLPTMTTPANRSDVRVVSHSARHQNGLTETYERLECVGEGTYGKVYKARNNEAGLFVALKRIRMEGEKDGFPITAMREIKLLQCLRHDNVVRLYEMMVSKGESTDR